jgi:hypothetical protein
MGKPLVRKVYERREIHLLLRRNRRERCIARRLCTLRELDRIGVKQERFADAETRLAGI